MRRHLRLSLILGIVGAILAASGVLLTPSAPAWSQEPTTVLDHGHIDAFNVSVAGGELALDLKESVDGGYKHHRPEDVVLHVKDAAFMEGIPEEYPGSPAAYYLPMTQDPNLIWPGWDTSALEGTGFGATEISVSDVAGPGEISLFTQDPVGAPLSVLVGGGYALPGTIDQKIPAHSHANWMFSKPGSYTFSVKVTGTKGGVTHASNSATYTIVVGGPTPTPTPRPTPTTTPTPTPTPTPKPTPTVRPTTPAPSTPAPGQVRLAKGHADVFHVRPTPAGALTLGVREDITGRGVLRTPEGVVFEVGDTARRTVPAGLPAGGTTAYVLPMVQDANLLWPGWSTEELAGSGLSSADVEVTAVSGPGKVHLFQTATFGGVASVLVGGGHTLPGRIRVPQPAHVHANWIFTAPGTYRLTARATSGGRASASHVYTFVVGGRVGGGPGGGSGGAVPPVPPPPPATSAQSGDSDLSGAPARQRGTRGSAPRGTAAQACVVRTPPGRSGPGVPVSSGHLDLGVVVNGSTLVAALKDDRVSPPSWVDPGSVDFVLTDAAKKVAPEALSFVARPGAHVWMIGSVQEPGVPWLGSNTQHPSLLAGTTGSVRWTLTSSDGPGKMAMFLPDAFGSGVGTRQLDNAGGPRSFVVPPNTHQHSTWVFTTPGVYRVTLTQTAVLTSGAAVSAPTVLTFVVGQPAGAPGTSAGAAAVGTTAGGKACTPSAAQLAQAAKAATLAGAALPAARMLQGQAGEAAGAERVERVGREGGSLVPPVVSGLAAGLVLLAGQGAAGWWRRRRAARAS